MEVCCSSSKLNPASLMPLDIHMRPMPSNEHVAHILPFEAIMAVLYDLIDAAPETLKSSLYTCRSYLTSHPRLSLYIPILLLAVSYLLVHSLRNSPRPLFSTRYSPDPEKPHSFKAVERQPGVWAPSDFRRPVAAPYPDWDVHTTKPLLYRPFRWGPYHITMGLRTMKWDEWIELDNQFPKFHADKAHRIAARGERCCKTAPEAYDGAVELLEELYAFPITILLPHTAFLCMVC
jgi:hypothetical protein